MAVVLNLDSTLLNWGSFGWLSFCKWWYTPFCKCMEQCPCISLSYLFTLQPFLFEIYFDPPGVVAVGGRDWSGSSQILSHHTSTGSRWLLFTSLEKLSTSMASFVTFRIFIRLLGGVVDVWNMSTKYFRNLFFWLDGPLCILLRKRGACFLVGSTCCLVLGGWVWDNIIFIRKGLEQHPKWLGGFHGKKPFFPSISRSWFQICCIFTPYLGKWSNLTNIFRWVESTNWTFLTQPMAKL